jgi:tellurite resistance protein TehA-like permease
MDIEATCTGLHEQTRPFTPTCFQTGVRMALCVAPLVMQWTQRAYLLQNADIARSLTFALSTAAAATASALSALYVVVGGGAALKLAGSALTPPTAGAACLPGIFALIVPFCEVPCCGGSHRLRPPG